MDLQNPRISVIVPVYKVEDYLQKCVDSLLVQTYQNMDIILVDDGSPDNCPKICDDYAEKYTNIIVLHKNNGGLGDARNYGVKYSDSEFIVFVDSDDYVEKDYVKTLVELKNQFDAEMAIIRVKREDVDGNNKQVLHSFENYLADRETALYQVYGGINVGWQAVGKLFSRNVLLKHPFPCGYNEDCACMYKIIDEVNRIAIGDYEHSYHYIYREGSILGSKLNIKHLHIFDIAEEFTAFIYQYHPNMEILILLFYSRIVVNLLNLQSMPWTQYKEIFFKYRSIFRKSVSKVMKDNRLDFKNKVYFLLLCGRPEFFYLQRLLRSLVR